VRVAVGLARLGAVWCRKVQPAWLERKSAGVLHVTACQEARMLCCAEHRGGLLVCVSVAAGAAGLAFMRVLAGGAIDAAKPIKEGLTEQQVADLLAATQAQEVRGAGSAATTPIDCQVLLCSAC
jgi:hypothetical protein